MRRRRCGGERGRRWRWGGGLRRRVSARGALIMVIRRRGVGFGGWLFGSWVVRTFHALGGCGGPKYRGPSLAQDEGEKQATTRATANTGVLHCVQDDEI